MIDPFHVPHNGINLNDLNLSDPIRHLLGNNIGIYAENCSQRIEMSLWLSKGEMTKNNKGLIHISPQEIPYDYSKPHFIALLEDISERDGRPENYPKIIERGTFPDIAKRSLYYPSSGEIWNFQIHLRHPGKIQEKPEEYELVKEGRLSYFGKGLHNFVECD
jgi:hypothetical protein